MLGDHANQAGSLVAPDRLPFDFTHFEKVSAEQLRAIEQLVNEQISAAKAVETSETSYDEAVAQGATALFGEKYGDQVRTVRVPDFSHELCGGTHVRNTAQIQYFRILNESSIATGVRRIEAVAGQAAIKVAELERTALAKTAALLKADAEHVPDRVEALLADLAKAARDAKSAAQARAGAQAAELLENVQQINGVNLLVARMDGLSADLLREAVDRFKSS
ncbi:MAG TPA: alanine--tRNA ligase, partial [Firmicutes bacterium]|nr:alanine--tRNA ligase [Bacillota bacterium]